METKTDNKSSITRRKSAQFTELCAKQEKNASLKKVSRILLKAEHERTLDDEQVLRQYSELAADLKLRWQRRDEAKRRQEEIEEPADILQQKCMVLAKAIMQAEHLVVYTGAGISTAARIPDYRGTNGIWTRLQQGKEIENHDLSLAEPTYTHMALANLYHQKILKYVVSQNCDGLHLRSGLPRSALSELHGNMYIEVCKSCKPVKEYWRVFDVTENTARYSHKTMRRCYACGNELVDTIVHFGERGTLQWPLNWPGACKNADQADAILCLGSSLKVLKKYPWLWQMNKPAKKRPNLYIVNLQWTPKDDCAVLKINGKCDVVMKMVMKCLGLQAPGYDRKTDPIFAHASYLCEQELHTTTQPFLKGVDADKRDLIKSETKVEDDLGSENETDRVTVITADQDSGLTDGLLCPDADTKCENGDDLSIYSDPSPEQEFPIDFTVNKCEQLFPRTNLNCDSANTQGSARTAKLHNGSSSTAPSHKRRPQDCARPGNSIFSIDSILGRRHTGGPGLDQNVQALMAYYELANSVLHGQFINYFTGLYPYQTSFLYPGLHSIINPNPAFNCDFEYAAPAVAPPPPPAEEGRLVVAADTAAPCDFCSRVFSSAGCLYYAPTESVYVKRVFRASKLTKEQKQLFCVCCDYSTEEESESDEGTLDAKPRRKAKRVLKEECCKDQSIECECASEGADPNALDSSLKKNEKVDGKLVRIQAGWFGKGCRKNKRVKKR